MRLIIKYLNLLILIVISLLQVQKVSAQDFDETLKFANYQFKSGNLAEASKTYQRALFFSEGRQNVFIFNRIAEIAYAGTEYETAQRYYGLAYDVSADESLRTELLFKKASCRMLDKNFQQALIDLFSIADSSVSTQNRLNFYLGICYYGLQDYKQSESYFESCIDERDRKDLSDLFTDRRLFSPSPRKARIMSMLLPGLGQTYSGDIKAGLNSILLNTGLIALGIKIGIIYSPLDAVFAILPWSQRYYTGGYGKAEEIAEKRREKNRNDIYVKILNLIDKNQNDQ
jgi:tetratricopeptide (TPR) repeat protein